MGWQILTRRVLEILVDEKKHIVFLLWGRDAQQQMNGLKIKDTQIVLKAAHPSPLGAHHHAPVPFKECNHFKLTNEYLSSNGIPVINWEI